MEPVRSTRNEQGSRKGAVVPSLHLVDEMLSEQKVRTSLAAPKPLQPRHTEQWERRIRTITRDQLQTPGENPAKVRRLILGEVRESRETTK